MTKHTIQSQSTPTSYIPFKRLNSSIGAKIVLPYFLLTLAVAGIGAFIVVRLTTASLQERFNNQLLDAGRVVSERMVDYEAERLEVLRAVISTIGVPESLAAGDRTGLAVWVPQLIANSNTDAVELLDSQGREVYGWQRPPNQAGFEGEERSGADYAHMPEVRRVLDGYIDEFGDKRVLLSQTPEGPMIFTIGPVYHEGEQVGAVLVGTYIQEMVVDLTENAIAKVTLYDPRGTVIATTLGGGQEGAVDILKESSVRYRSVLARLRQSPTYNPVVITNAEDEVPLRQVQILGQEYTLAYGDWQLRGQSMGLFSVGLPSNFIVSAAATSRNLLSLVFAIATIFVFVLGFLIAQRIIRPLHRLVQTSNAVAEGNLEQRTGIQRTDEIGSLARSFDVMTDRLAERNRELVAQASKLEAILDSIADGVVVLDWEGRLISSNPAAKQILADVSSDFLTEILRELPTASILDPKNSTDLNHALKMARLRQPRRYEVGDRVLSALIAPMKTPGGDELGTVIALRDITRQAEADQLKDNFITGVSHELRTPLTAVKGYTDLLLMKANNSFSEEHMGFLEIIDRNVDKLLHNINAIIDISEIQAGTLWLNKREICFSELVKEGTEAWRSEIEAKVLALHVTLSEEDLYVYGDPDRLSWALDNLLDNAYNYTLPGGRIEVVLGKEEDEVRVDVIDTGVGIAIADQPYLFTRFFRASHQKTFNIPGVGLGLFITHALINLHDGRVWAESKLDAGSTFSLALPLLGQPELATDPLPFTVGAKTKW